MLTMQYVPTRFGATAEEEKFFEEEAPPFGTCADKATFEALLAQGIDKDDLVLSCIVRAYRQPEGIGLSVARRMIGYIQSDPDLGPRMDELLRVAMNTYGVSTEFINAALAIESEEDVFEEPRSVWPWLVGGVILFGTVGALALAIHHSRS